MPPDPLVLGLTSLSSPVGQLVILLGLVGSLVVMLRWWWQNRGR